MCSSYSETFVDMKVDETPLMWFESVGRSTMMGTQLDSGVSYFPTVVSYIWWDCPTHLRWSGQAGTLNQHRGKPTRAQIFGKFLG